MNVNQNSKSISEIDAKREGKASEKSCANFHNAGDPCGSRKKRKFNKIEENNTSGDVYKWCKYGEKPRMDNVYIRSYYRCSNKETKCSVKKIVDRHRTCASNVKISYDGDHNHPPPTTREVIIYHILPDGKHKIENKTHSSKNIAVQSDFPRTEEVENASKLVDTSLPVEKRVCVSEMNEVNGRGFEEVFKENKVDCLENGQTENYFGEIYPHDLNFNFEDLSTWSFSAEADDAENALTLIDDLVNSQVNNKLGSKNSDLTEFQELENVKQATWSSESNSRKKSL